MVAEIHCLGGNMNGKLIGMRSLIAFLSALTTLVLAAKFIPGELTAITATIVALFGMLLGRRKEAKE